MNRLILILSFVTAGANARTGDSYGLRAHFDSTGGSVNKSIIARAIGGIVIKDEESEKPCAQFDSIGSPCTMNQENAIAYCESQGGHLPSAREMARLLGRFHADGVVDRCNNNDDKCSKISVQNHDKKRDKNIDEFYLNYSGYTRDGGDLGSYQFWLSSSSTRYPDILGATFLGHVGDIDYAEKKESLAVLCFHGP